MLYLETLILILMFLSIFLYGFNFYFPLKRCGKFTSVRSNGRKQRMGLYTDDLKILKDRVWKLFGFLKWAPHLNINIVEAKISYANAKKEYAMAIKQAKYNFNESFINDSANKCKTAWQVIYIVHVILRILKVTSVLMLMLLTIFLSIMLIISQKL